MTPLHRVVGRRVPGGYGSGSPRAARRRRLLVDADQELPVDALACAAWLIEAGTHPLQIKLRLGHNEIRTTMDTYGHLFPSAEPELADLLDAGVPRRRRARGGRATRLMRIRLVQAACLSAVISS